jgi:DUF3096 family protein
VAAGLTGRIGLPKGSPAITHNNMNGDTVTINLALGPVVSLIAGILILIVPRLLNFIVAIYLILIGLIGIFGWGGLHARTAEAAEPHEHVVALYYVNAANRPAS